MQRQYSIILVIIAIISISCGGGSSDSGETDTVSVPLFESNPIVRTQFFGVDGNLYKPESDLHGSGGGNLVVLIGAQFAEQFDSCEIPLADGSIAPLACLNSESWTEVPFSCFSNGNRQTWRANFRCSSVAEVKVTCRSFNQEVVFTVPEELRGNVCTRYG